MNEIKVFENQQFGELRMVEKDGEPWFVAADVCRALDIDRSQTRRLDDDEKGVYSILTLGGLQEVTIVNEPGLYGLVLGSRKPEAKAFKRWVKHEVLPSIRRHGMYATAETAEKLLNDPDFMIKTLETLKAERAARQAAEAHIEANAPKVLFAESVQASKQSILIGELAKLLKQNGVEIGQNRLFNYLRSEGFLGTRGEYKNMPTQKAMEMKLFEVKETTITNADGSVRLTRTPKVTGKGQVYFVNRFLKKA